MPNTLSISPVQPDECALLLDLIKQLARFEKAEHEVIASVEDTHTALFGDEVSTYAVIARLGGEAVGYAIYFYNYSTWLGQRGLFLEDLYVQPVTRGKGVGKAMLSYLANIALAKGCGRFEWNVLDWNTPAIEFYESIGAVAQSEWQGYRLTGPALKQLAQT